MKTHIVRGRAYNHIQYVSAMIVAKSIGILWISSFAPLIFMTSLIKPNKDQTCLETLKTDLNKYICSPVKKIYTLEVDEAWDANHYFWNGKEWMTTEEMIERR